MTDRRLTLALPIDVVRQFDSTVTQAQIEADTFQQSGDDDDLLTSWIEDAEDEFRRLTDESMRVTRSGVAGNRPTFEETTYKLSGHKAYRQSFSHHTFDYDYRPVTMQLDNERVLPFDPDAGDQIYVFRGLGDSVGGNWEDITDQEGEIWQIVNYVDGELMIHPQLLHEALLNDYDGLPGGGSRLRNVRIQITYRYGGLGGSREQAAQTELDASLTDSETGSVGVADGSRFPTSGNGGSIVVKVDGEYIEVLPDPANDEMEILERGVRGTTANAHDSGALVQYTPPSIRKAVASRAGMQLISSSQYRGYLANMDAELGESEMYDNLESTWNATVEALS